jgi:hypothetical protein
MVTQLDTEELAQRFIKDRELARQRNKRYKQKLKEDGYKTFTCVLPETYVNRLLVTYSMTSFQSLIERALNEFALKKPPATSSETLQVASDIMPKTPSITPPATSPETLQVTSNTMPKTPSTTSPVTSLETLQVTPQDAKKIQ